MMYPKPMPGRRIKAQDGKHARVSAQSLSQMAQTLGRCGNINPITGDVCVTQPHDDDVEHMAIQIGGPRDGYVYATWGGRKVNAGVIRTKAVPDE